MALTIIYNLASFIKLSIFLEIILKALLIKYNTILLI